MMNTYETEEKQDSELTDDAKLVRGWKNSCEEVDLNMSRSMQFSNTQYLNQSRERRAEHWEILFENPYLQQF